MDVIHVVIPSVGKVSPQVYDGDDLDLLAMYFTLVKVLYLQGSLAIIPSIIRLIEPTRR